MDFCKSNILLPLTKDQKDQVLINVGYTERQLESDLQHIKEWLAEQYHLPSSRLTENDSFLQCYLTGNKGSLEKTKRKLDAYYTCRANSDLLANRDPLEPTYILTKEISLIATLPQCLSDGARVTMNTLIDGDPVKFDTERLFKRLLNIIELRLRMEGISSPNLVIFDVSAISMSHLSHISPTATRDFLHLIQNILPMRIKAIYFINAPAFVEILVNNTIKPFMTKKIKERIFITSSGHEELHKHIEKNVFPKDYGGVESKTLKEFNEEWIKLETNGRTWFTNELSQLPDESRRIITDTGNDTDLCFGIQGSLKKLVID